MSRRTAFTLIEVLVSVVLISIVVLGIMKIREQNIAAAQYIGNRIDSELEDTLFLGKELIRYNGSSKDAYSIVKDMGISRDATRLFLKKIERTILVSDPLPTDKLPLNIELRSITLKKEHSERFYRLFP